MAITGPQSLSRGEVGRLLIGERVAGVARSWRIDLSPTTGRRVLFVTGALRRYWRLHPPETMTFEGRTVAPPYRYGRPKPPPAVTVTLTGEVIEVTAAGVVLRELPDE